MMAISPLLREQAANDRRRKGSAQQDCEQTEDLEHGQHRVQLPLMRMSFRRRDAHLMHAIALVAEPTGKLACRRFDRPSIAGIFLDDDLE